MCVKKIYTYTVSLDTQMLVWRAPKQFLKDHQIQGYGGSPCVGVPGINATRAEAMPSLYRGFGNCRRPVRCPVAPVHPPGKAASAKDFLVVPFWGKNSCCKVTLGRHGGIVDFRCFVFKGSTTIKTTSMLERNKACADVGPIDLA